MSQVAEKSVGPITMDPYEIGWYIESADEEIYGPVSRKALRRFLEEKTITPNTLVRHCTQPEARPAADQPVIMEQPQPRCARDRRSATSWPRHGRARTAIGRPWRKTRCRAAGINGPPCWSACDVMLPIATSAGPSPSGSSSSCAAAARRHVQPSIRRADCWIIVILVYVPVIIAVVLLALRSGWPRLSGADRQHRSVRLPLPSFSSATRSFGGAGLGKRATGLRVVQSKDGKTPLTLRPGRRALAEPVHSHSSTWSMLSVPYRDPLLRRYGDRWAGTRVLDTERKLAKVPAKLARRLIKKGIQPPPEVGMTMEGLARIA